MPNQDDVLCLRSPKGELLGAVWRTGGTKARPDLRWRSVAYLEGGHRVRYMMTKRAGMRQVEAAIKE